ncbi:MAG: hypothetical protein B0W54_15945 [Cellvibrio sp. 79]|nr:MAG: hypothetical protein B0W54_15945 [Cellvibrio sp. 79]
MGGFKIQRVSYQRILDEKYHSLFEQYGSHHGRADFIFMTGIIVKIYIYERLAYLFFFYQRYRLVPESHKKGE